MADSRVSAVEEMSKHIVEKLRNGEPLSERELKLVQLAFEAAAHGLKALLEKYTEEELARKLAMI
jgi:hypothetical protein